MTKGKGHNRRIYTVADAKRLGPSTFGGVSFDVPLGPFDGVVTQIVGASDLAKQVKHAKHRIAHEHRHVRGHRVETWGD